MWFEILTKWVLWESESSNYWFPFCEWGRRCIFQEHLHTCQLLWNTNKGCNSSLTCCRCRCCIWISLSEALDYRTCSKRSTEICHFLKANVSVWTCDPVCSARFFSFKWNQGHPRGQSVAACPTYGHFKMNPSPSPGVLARLPCHNTIQENMKHFSLNKL